MKNGVPMSESQRRRGRRAIVVAIVATAVVLVGGTVAATAIAGRLPLSAVAAASGTPAPSVTPTPIATPLSPQEQLLADSGDPNACAVTFAGDGITDAPLLETQGSLYANLPIPSGDGLVFAGWYATPEDATSHAIPGRVNGADAVTCTDQQTTLYGAWMTPEENAAAATRVPILMYHQFTTKPEGESGWLRGNYAYIGDFEQHMDHIASTGFYLPTWDELSAFIDGRLYLPNHSVIVTDDDCDISWLQMGIPIVVEKKVLTTAFCITIDGTGPSPSEYVQQRSHTHDMHRAGADGQGRITTLTVPEIVADMEASAAALGGVKQVMAYPFGHYNDTAKEGLRQAGFEMARTIEPGYVTIGTDKLAMPTVRINYGMGLDALVNLIG
ncbi:polysaccharide deacetylase family protein [Microbacterium sp.]|uniref:polysaccharide deacetylase family protein n=1 Tax=Microbacterium sp. TaxID=51671 RepID=UPI003F72A434